MLANITQRVNIVSPSNSHRRAKLIRKIPSRTSIHEPGCELSGVDVLRAVDGEFEEGPPFLSYGGDVLNETVAQRDGLASVAIEHLNCILLLARDFPTIIRVPLCWLPWCLWLRHRRRGLWDIPWNEGMLLMWCLRLSRHRLVRREEQGR